MLWFTFQTSRIKRLVKVTHSVTMQIYYYTFHLFLLVINIWFKTTTASKIRVVNLNRPISHSSQNQHNQKISRKSFDDFVVTYAPCTFQADPFPNKVSIICDSNISNASFITNAFTQSESNIITEHQLVHIQLEAFNDIPDDLMGTKSNTRHLKLTCPDANFELKINSNAFRSSRSTALGVSIEKCDLRQLDWRFLSEFSVLESLHLVGSSMMNNMQTFPLLTSVSTFSMLNCGHFDELYPPERTPHLNHLQIDNSFNVSDEIFDRIVNAAAAGPYRDTLEVLSLARNKMTRIPSSTANFTRLQHLIVSGNSIQTLPRGSLHFSSTSLSTVWLNYNRIDTIQQGAFKGDFGRTRLFLNDNNLTRFEYDVFSDVLQIMAQGKGHNESGIDINNNPIMCDCGISWLIDRRGTYLPKVLGGQCTNLVDNMSQLQNNTFEDLNFTNFITCFDSSKIGMDKISECFAVAVFYIYWLANRTV